MTNRYSRIFHHISTKDLKRNREIVVEKRGVNIRIQEEKRIFSNIFKHSWRRELEEGMTSSGIFTTVLSPEGDTAIDSVNTTDAASYQPTSGVIDSGDDLGALTGTTIRSSGSGSGNDGGFDVGGEYLAFQGTSDRDNNRRFAALAPIDSTRIDTLTISAIVGNGSNGGRAPIGSSMSLFLYYKTPAMSDAFPIYLTPSLELGLSGDDQYIIQTGDGFSNDGGLNNYSQTIPEYARAEGTRFILFQNFAVDENGNKIGANYGVTDIKFQRRVPMSVVIPLDDPQAISFINVGTKEGDPKKRKKKVQDQLDASESYLKKQFGDDFPRGANLTSDDDVEASPMGKDEVERKFSDFSAQTTPSEPEAQSQINSQISDNKIENILINNSKTDEKSTSDPENYNLDGLTQLAIDKKYFDPNSPVNPDAHFYARVNATSDALKAAYDAEFYGSLARGDSPNYKSSFIQNLKAQRDQAREDLKGWEKFKSNNNWKYLGPNIGNVNEPKPDFSNIPKTSENILADLDATIAKYSAMEQAAYAEMKRIALEYGLDVISLVGGLFTGGTSLAGSPTLSKLLLKLAKKSGKGIFGRVVRSILRRTQKADVYSIDDIPDFIDQQTPKATPKPKPKPQVPAGEVGSIDPKTGLPRGGAGKSTGLPDIDPTKIDDIASNIKRPDGKPFDPLPRQKDFSLDPIIKNVKKKKKRGGSFKESTLFERIKSKSFFNPKDIKPTFPENPPPKLDPKTGMHPDYGKSAKRYKKLDPASANAMPRTGDPETDAIVDKQRTKPRKN